MHEIRLHLYVYTFEKEITDIQKLIPPSLQDLRYKINEDLFIGGDLSEVVNHHHTPSRQPDQYR